MPKGLIPLSKIPLPIFFKTPLPFGVVAAAAVPNAVVPAAVVPGFRKIKFSSLSTGWTPILESRPAVNGKPPGPVKSSFKDAIRGIFLKIFLNSGFNIRFF